MISIAGPFNSGEAVGNNGVATANANSMIRLRGKIMGIYVKYNDSPPAATTDVVIKALGTSPAAPTYNLLALANGATDGWRYPQALIHTVAGVEIAGEYTPLLIDDYINVLIDQANAGDNVDVWLMLEL
ncbi:MAG: hypothetical protein C4575_12915 [Desulforudis sp.]|jgi:hypothetical protein|nr:MAG: hypothetical protein C4575_12915 [Desulforudis sp.]